MLDSPDLSFSRTLPSDVFNQLDNLLEKMAQAVGKGSLVLTEAVLATICIPGEWQRLRFAVVVSEGFNALMVGNPEEDGEEGDKGDGEGECSSIPLLCADGDSLLNVKLTFNIEAIASFLEKLRDLFECNSHTYQKIESYRQILAPNNATLQSQFTLLLLEYLLPQPNQEVTEPLASTIPGVSVCQPVEDALKKQLAQEQLFNQVTTQIRQSLDLPVIMTTAIEQVRQFLELDRLVICKLPTPPGEKLVELSSLEGLMSNTPNLVNNYKHFNSERRTLYSRGETPAPQSTEVNYTALEFSSSSTLIQDTGYIIHESRASDAIPSILNFKEEQCFAPNSPSWQKYCQGFTLAVDDVEKTYVLEEGLLGFLRNMQVRAKFVAPIVFGGTLWGTLIAHQCNAPRQWTESDKNLLTSIAEQLAIAIHQAELMRSLTQEKQTLEERVIERTVALHDALVAAEAASRLRSEFLATVSHELLTPLTYVIGMSSTLLRWSFGELNERQRNYLQTIHDSGEHLLEMINDILDLSQLEAGKAVLNITEFSLVDVAEDTIASLLEEGTSEQINLKLDLQIDRQRDRFTADVRRVQQILGNLLSNAIKFTPEGGNVTLRLWVEDDTAVFQVEDTGIGIPEEQLPLLFEKFHQLDTPYRRRYEGTGLGLALTKQLVELHRGRIEVESIVGVGSIFTVWIPGLELGVRS